MKVLTWNLFHGRSVPETKHALLDEFTDKISGWDWDVALLQEVPPWWPPALARAAGAQQRTVLTSRNALLPLRRWIAERRPDLIKSNGGGANAILVRGDRIAAHAALRLRWRPERRMLHAVHLAAAGIWVANVHATANPKPLARADMVRCGETLARWAGAAPGAAGRRRQRARPRRARLHRRRRPPHRPLLRPAARWRSRRRRGRWSATASPTTRRC